MAEKKNHGGMIPEMMHSSLAGNGNPSTLLPKLGSSTNEPCTDLQLSLGGLYDDGDGGGGVPVSAPAPALLTSSADNSVQEGSFSAAERNRFLQKEVVGVMTAEEIQMIMNPPENEKSKKVNTLVSPNPAIPVLAAQTAFGNPALQRALNLIKTNGITTIPRGTNLFRGYPSSVEGFPSQNPIGVPIETHVNNRANPMLFLQPKCVNLVPPIKFSSLCRNLIPNQQSNTVKPVPPSNYFLTTFHDQPWNKSTNGLSNLRKHSLGMRVPPFATSSSTSAKIPYPFQTSSNTKGQNIPIIPQNATRHNNNNKKPYIHSNLFTNTKLAQPFPPISNNTNGNRFIPQRTQPFAQIINSSRTQVRHNRIDPPEYPCKRPKREIYENNNEDAAVELQLMKKLPIVITTGGNPNGKKIEGLLYKYGNDQEVTIVCVCHGCFFTAEEFVRHAGGGNGAGNIENPRQHISIMDYPN